MATSTRDQAAVARRRRALLLGYAVVPGALAMLAFWLLFLVAMTGGNLTGDMSPWFENELEALDAVPRFLIMFVIAATYLVGGFVLGYGVYRRLVVRIRTWGDDRKPPSHLAVLALGLLLPAAVASTLALGLALTYVAGFAVLAMLNQKA